MNDVTIDLCFLFWNTLNGLRFQEVTWVVSLLSAIISQDAVGAPRSIALMSEFISCCSAATPEDPPFCNIPVGLVEKWTSIHHPLFLKNKFL